MLGWVAFDVAVDMVDDIIVEVHDHVTASRLLQVPQFQVVVVVPAVVLEAAGHASCRS